MRDKNWKNKTRLQRKVRPLTDLTRLEKHFEWDEAGASLPISGVQRALKVKGIKIQGSKAFKLQGRTAKVRKDVTLLFRQLANDLRTSLFFYFHQIFSGFLIGRVFLTDNKHYRTLTMDQGKKIKLNFEDDIKFDGWKMPRRSSLVREYSEAIADMKVNQSFEFMTEKWSEIECVRNAFKIRGWKCSTQSKSPRKTGKLGWIFRVWRTA